MRRSDKMQIVYLSRKSFNSMESEGFRARRGNVTAYLLKSSRIHDFQYVWFDYELGRKKDKVIEGSVASKLNLTKIPRLPFPYVRSISLLKRVDDTFKSRLLTRIVKNDLNTRSQKVILTHDPRFLFILNNHLISRACVVTDLIDDFRIHPHLTESERENYRLAYSLLSEKSDIVFTVGKMPAEQLKGSGINSFWIPNGVDWQRFRGTIENPPKEPDDLIPLSHPRIAFIGILSSATDYELLNKVAEEIRDGSVIFIGEWMGTPGQLDKRIHCLGFKPADEIHHHFAHIDMGLSVYKQNEFSNSVDSMKIYEYLAAGKPVVANASQEMLSRFQFVRQAGSSDEFVEAVKQTCQELGDTQTKEKAIKISESVRNCDWNQRIDHMLDIISNYNGKSPGNRKGH
jgi:glycosyltransferase involved in cell wall biosynthesis